MDEETGANIAVVYNGDAYTDLVAAAPELLEALEGLLNVVEAEPEACGIYRAHTEKARAAIAKAKA
jgi:hypothetical protein